MEYSERRFDGTRKFQLVGNTLRISGKNSLRSEFETTVDLSKVSPAYGVMHIRHRAFFVFFIALIASASAGLFFDEWMLAIPGIVLCLVFLVPTFPKQKFYQFAYESGGVAFDLCEAGPHKKQLEAYVTALVEVIQRAGE